MNLYGVQPEFGKFSRAGTAITIQPDSVLLNEVLAAQLRVKAGDAVLFRLREPTVFSSEAPLSSRSGNSVALRLRVQGILTPAQYGDFSPVAAAAAPRNAFMRLDQLQQAAGLEHRANLVLEAGTTDLPKDFSAVHRKLREWLVRLGLRSPGWLAATAVREASPATGAAVLDDFFWESWSAADAGLDFQVQEQPPVVELRSTRVFLDPAVVRRVTRYDGSVVGAGPVSIAFGKEVFLLTYLANLLRAGTNATPYSMVTAVGPPYTPAGMGDDEIVVNSGWRRTWGCVPATWCRWRISCRTRGRILWKRQTGFACARLCRSPASMPTGR